MATTHTSTEDPWPPIRLTSEVSPEGIPGAIFRLPDIDLRCQHILCSPSRDPRLMDLVPITTSRPPMRFQGQVLTFLSIISQNIYLFKNLT